MDLTFTDKDYPKNYSENFFSELMNDMKLAALLAGKNAYKIQREGRKNSSLKQDQSIITIGDTEGEQIIRDILGKYAFNILGEEQGFTDNNSDFSIIIDPIDGTTNYDIGDPDWLVSIGLMYKNKPFLGITYQPALDKLYYAQAGKGCYLDSFGETQKLEVAPPPTRSYIVDLLFARHPNFERQGVFYARTFEEIPDVLEKIAGRKINPKYRTTGCPSVPMCGLADGVRSALIAKPVWLWDIAASIVIAQEAGAKIHVAPENPEKNTLNDPLMVVSAVPEIFPTIMNIFNTTIANRASVYNSTSNQNIPEKFAEKNIKYGISVGRRQPMHIVHVDCIKEIKEAGLIPVITIGSVNATDSEYYDPLKNPLSLAQQQEQIKIAMKQAGIDNYLIKEIRDRGSMQHWVSTINWILQESGIASFQSVMHYRSKSADKERLEGKIRPLSAYQETIIDYGISVWESVNKNPEHDKISASPFRLSDLEKLSDAEKSVLATPEYIISIAQNARNNNPDKNLLSHLPITMLDLTLERLLNGKNMKTSDILNGKSPKNFEDFYNAIADFLSMPHLEVGGEIKGKIKAEQSKKDN